MSDKPEEQAEDPGKTGVPTPPTSVPDKPPFPSPVVIIENDWRRDFNPPADHPATTNEPPHQIPPDYTAVITPTTQGVTNAATE